jgi:hypothetical protein
VLDLKSHATNFWPITSHKNIGRNIGIKYQDIPDILCNALRKYKYVFCCDKRQVNEVTKNQLSNREIFNLTEFGLSEDAYHQKESYTLERFEAIQVWCLLNYKKLNLLETAVRETTFDYTWPWPEYAAKLSQDGYIKTTSRIENQFCIQCVFCNNTIYIKTEKDFNINLHKHCTPSCVLSSNILFGYDF